MVASPRKPEDRYMDIDRSILYIHRTAAIVVRETVSRSNIVLASTSKCDLSLYACYSSKAGGVMRFFVPSVVRLSVSRITHERVNER